MLCKTQVDSHPLARITGAPKLHNGRLYVPIASLEEPESAGNKYPCCTFRGAIVALDSETGKQVWKTYTIPQEPKVIKRNSAGVALPRAIIRDRISITRAASAVSAIKEKTTILVQT